MERVADFLVAALIFAVLVFLAACVVILLMEPRAK